MKNFILDKHPNFGEAKVTLTEFSYELQQIKGKGASFSITHLASGTEQEKIFFSKDDLKALFLLICTEK